MKRQAGFSLVELMIVVAIMAILAAIAIPSFMRFSMRAKTAEATQNLAAIRSCQESYRAEEDEYWICPPTPGGWANGPGASSPIAWAGGGVAEFDKIGFAPDGNVRYQYQVQAGTGGAASGTGGINGPFMATAVGDLDEDTDNALFTVDKGDPLNYPKGVKSGGSY